MVTLLLAASLVGTNCNQVVIRQPSSLVVQQQTPGFFFLVGSELRTAALVENYLRTNPEYREFLEWKAQQGGDQPDPQPAAPTVKAMCSKCHSGDEPKGGHTRSLSSEVPGKLVACKR